MLPSFLSEYHFSPIYIFVFYLFIYLLTTAPCFARLCSSLFVYLFIYCLFIYLLTAALCFVRLCSSLSVCSFIYLLTSPSVLLDYVLLFQFVHLFIYSPLPLFCSIMFFSFCLFIYLFTVCLFIYLLTAALCFVRLCSSLSVCSFIYLLNSPSILLDYVLLFLFIYLFIYSPLPLFC